MEDLREKLLNVFNNAFLGIGISLGYNLKLFDAIADVSSEESPALVLTIANKAALKERYVREWLGAMVCAGLVEVDESGEHFWIKNEYRKILCGPDVFFLIPGMNMINLYSGMVNKIENIFTKDGPKGAAWSDYNGFHKYIELFTQGMWGKDYADKFISTTGFEEKLRNHVTEAIDIGCGNGYHLRTFSKALPNLKFTGIDISKEAIVNAKRQEQDPKNIEFIEMSSEQMPKEWTSRFEWVMMFDCAHDQPRPDLTFKEIYRIMKDDGVFTMVDIDGTGNIHLDKKQDGDKAALFYLFSTFTCLPCSSNTSDALCLGSKWGRTKAVELLNNSGFLNVNIVPLNVKDHVLYVCTKH